MNAMSLAAQLLRREWRAGELRILMIALLIAVSCMTSVSLFGDRITRAMSNQASDLLGGDLALTSANPLPAAWITQAKNTGLRTTETVGFSSMLMANNQLQLASIKAVADNYPLRGQVRISNQVNQSGATTRVIPAPGTIWLEAGLPPLLQLQPGDVLSLGAAQFQFTHVLTYQPESSASMLALAPQAMINSVDIAKTAVIQPGSRIVYTLLFAGSTSQLIQFRNWLQPQLMPGQKLLDASNSRPNLQASLENVQHYLGLGSLISVILAGVALAVALKRFSCRHYDCVALMRCYGASSRQILMIYLWLLLVVGLLSILLACLIGYFAQTILAHTLSLLIKIQLPTAKLSGIWFGAIAGLWVLLAFGIPPLWQLTRVAPLKVLQRDLIPMPVSSIWLYGSGLLAVSALIFYHIQNAKLTLIILAGCVVASGVFLAGAFGLIRLTQLARQRVGVAWRYGFANLGRRWQSSVLQISAFGFTLMVLLLLMIVRDDMVTAWQNELPPDAPNYFVINIAPEQVMAVKQQLAQQAVNMEQIFPMVRGRLATLNQRPIVSALPADKRKDESLNRELNLSWTNVLPHNNQLSSGRWWQPGDKNVISIEQGLAQRLGLKLGDELGFRIGAQTISAKIISIRQLNWSSLQPNFYVLFPPGALTGFPATYITSFYLPAQNSQLQLNQLIQHFSNLNVINIAEILKQVQDVLTQAGHAIQYLFLFALLAGLVVLYSSVYSSLDQRLFEGALLRVLGASRYQLLTALIAEFVTLGVLAGFLAGCVANLIGIALAHWLFHLSLHFNGWLVLIGALMGALIIGIVGVYATRAVLRQSPLQTMRGGNGRAIQE